MDALRNLLFLLAITGLLLPGCAKRTGSTLFKPSHSTTKTLTVEDLDQIRWRMRAIAETYVIRLTQACDDLERKTTDPELKKGLRNIKILQMSAALSSAVGTQPVVNLLDLAAQITLMRSRLQDLELPQYGDAVVPLLNNVTKSETDVWEAVAQVTSAEQAEDLRLIINEWRKENPDQRHVSYVRFSAFADFAAHRPGAGGSSSNNLLSLLYIDPLSKLDPVAAEVAESRALAERLTYLIQRLPLLLQMQADSSVAKVMESPAISSFLNSTGRFSDATDRFATATSAYPEALAKERETALKQAADLVQKEREAAIKQLDERLTDQQSALFDNLREQQDLVAAKLQTTDQVMDKIRLGVSEINTTGRDTVAAADAALNRTIDHAFKLLVILILLILIGTPISVIVTRKLRRGASNN